MLEPTLPFPQSPIALKYGSVIATLPDAARLMLTLPVHARNPHWHNAGELLIMAAGDKNRLRKWKRS